MTAESSGRGKGEPLIPKHGGYRRLKSFQVAQLVYDVTVRFCGGALRGAKHRRGLYGQRHLA
jgi:hypothetical protein